LARNLLRLSPAVCADIGSHICGDADTHGYILESLLHYTAQKGVAAKMEELGLARVQVINLMGGIMSINYGEKPL